MRLTLIPIVLILPLLIFSACSTDISSTEMAAVTQEPYEYAIVIHGGAGSIVPGRFSDEEEQAFREALGEAVSIGEEILEKGGSSMEAVLQTIEFLENSPHFNAGKGAVFTHEGTHELDASLMDGANMQAGAVGGVTNLKNPIKAAYEVMQNSPHVLLTGQGAEAFAIQQGLDTVSNEYFYTEQRWKSLQRALDREPTGSLEKDPYASDYKYGTVGCVALDKAGNIVAGTSTGGMTNKRYNRLGDSPIIGAGTYAKNATCGVSCTGHGEYFIRYAIAHDLSARMEYLGEDLQTAADYLINTKLKNLGASGGLIALDKYGNFAIPFNTGGMFWGYARPGYKKVGMFEGE